MMTRFRERRSSTGTVELRDANGGTGGHLCIGYAAVFNRRSVDLGGFTEIVDPKAFNRTVSQADVMALWNHNDSELMARTSSGTLALNIDGRGLGYAFSIPETTYGHNLAVMLGRGDVRGSSFGFWTVGDDWLTESDGQVTRTLLEVGLYDVSPVSSPAYPDTDSALRSLARKTGRDMKDVRSAIEQRAVAELLTPGAKVYSFGGVKRSASLGESPDDSDADPVAMAQSVDAALDSASSLFAGVDTTGLPPEVAQGIALANAAGVTIDSLLVAIGAHDADMDSGNDTGDGDESGEAIDDPMADLYSDVGTMMSNPASESDSAPVTPIAKHPRMGWLSA